MAAPRVKPQPLAYSAIGAAETLSISIAKFEQIISRGDIAPRWIDGKRVFTAEELHAYVDSLPYDKPQ